VCEAVVEEGFVGLRDGVAAVPEGPGSAEFLRFDIMVCVFAEDGEFLKLELKVENRARG
jgi:hypothetical protein